MTQDYSDGLYSIEITGSCAEETVTLTIALPEGWDGFIGMTDSEYEPEINNDPVSAKRNVNAIADDDETWVPVDQLEAMGYKKGNVLTFAVDGDDHFAGLFLYKGDMANMDNQVRIDFSVEKSADTGISSIQAAASETRYFNLQGVEVSNPENGIYIKVSNGKVSKVTVK